MRIKPKKKLLHIQAYSKLYNKKVDLQYYSLKQAKFFNPALTNFIVVGIVK